MDACKYFCTNKSYSGCTPATLYARGMIDRGNKGLRGYTSVDRPMGFRIASMAVQESEAGVGKAIAMKLIRSYTFNRLGMKHTCCIHQYNDPHANAWKRDAEGKILIGRGTVTWDILQGTFHPIVVMDPEEIAEIQEEGKGLATQLDHLMNEFEAEYDELGVSFETFLFEHCWKRMDDIEAEGDQLAPQEIEAIREIGVVLED